MTADNPGAWPDQVQEKLEYCPLCKVWHGDEDDGKVKARTTGAIVSIGATKNCFTAADLKAARLETVERCLHLLDLYISNVGPLAAKKAIEMFKEEINEG
jgi:hypothetical protein